MKQSTNTEGTNSTQAIGGGAAKEPIHSDVTPSTVEYADIDKIVPILKASAQPLSYDDVVISISGTTVIGATGGDTNPPPIPDKKSKGAATTGQGGTNY